MSTPNPSQPTLGMNSVTVGYLPKISYGHNGSTSFAYSGPGLVPEGKVVRKECKTCHNWKIPDDFPKSATARDGRLGYCAGCWSDIAKHASAVAKRNRLKAVPAKPAPVKLTKPQSKKPSRALRGAATAGDSQFLIVADDGDVFFSKSEKVALEQAMKWKIDGYQVKIWRQCKFEMILRFQND